AGSHFTGATGVSFGSAAAYNFTVISDSAIVATAPAGTGGTIDVTVTTFSGTSSTSSSDHYTYNAVSAPTVTALDISSGATGGGTAVTLTGTGFDTVSSVSFGGVAASFLVVSPTSIVATSPAEAAGTIDVSVTNAGGTSALSSADRYSYTAAAAPAVT